MLTAEEIFTLAEPFGAFQYGDAQGDKRIAFARVIEHAACEDLLAEIDRLRAALQHEADCVEAAKAEIDRLTRERDEARAERDALAKALDTIHSWLVCAAIASAEDMAQSFAEMEQIAAAALAQIEKERSEQAKADDSMLQWIKLTDRMPNPHGRVLIFTEGYDFNGEQVFDVKAETLNECFYADPDDQPEVCRVASHWMPHPTEWRPCECESQYDD